jgi:hypothetical protein
MVNKKSMMMRIVSILLLWVFSSSLWARDDFGYYHFYNWPRPFYGYPSLYYSPYHFGRWDRDKKKSQRPSYRPSHPYGYYYHLQEQPPRQP